MIYSLHCCRMLCKTTLSPGMAISVWFTSWPSQFQISRLLLRSEVSWSPSLSLSSSSVPTISCLFTMDSTYRALPPSPSPFQPCLQLSTRYLLCSLFHCSLDFLHDFPIFNLSSCKWSESPLSILGPAISCNCINLDQQCPGSKCPTS